MIPVNVVTGFLGSGKTTLLREILQHPEFADSAVIVNEFGEVGLDHLLLEEVEEGVLLLQSGCICCTIRADLKETIRRLHDRAARGEIPPFRRLVIETTGLADPAPIVSTIAADPIIRNHFRAGNIICTVDGQNGLRTLQTQPEARKQVAVADRLLVTKTDLASKDDVAALTRMLSSLNPIAPVTTSCGTGFDADLIFGTDIGDEGRRGEEAHRWFFRAEEIAAPESGQDSNHDIGETNSFVLRYADPIDWTAFGIWLTALLHAHGEKVLRVKGILNVLELATPVVLHGVQHVVHPPLHLEHWPDEDRQSRIVFITRGISEQKICRSLAAFLAMAQRLQHESAVA